MSNCTQGFSGTSEPSLMRALFAQLPWPVLNAVYGLLSAKTSALSGRAQEATPDFVTTKTPEGIGESNSGAISIVSRIQIGSKRGAAFKVAGVPTRDSTFRGSI